MYKYYFTFAEFLNLSVDALFLFKEVPVQSITI